MFFVCPALNSINVDGLNEYLPTKSANSLTDGEISCSTSVALHDSVVDRSTTNGTEQEELEI